MADRLFELHLNEAKIRAIRLIQASSAITPKEWESQISEMVTLDLMEFVLHARRIVDAAAISVTNFQEAAAFRYAIEVNHLPSPIETNFRRALDRVVHAKEYTIGWTIWDGNKIFQKSSENQIITFAKIATDKKPEAYVSIFGIAWCFLSEVLNALPR